MIGKAGVKYIKTNNTNNHHYLLRIDDMLGGGGVGPNTLKYTVYVWYTQRGP